MPPSPPPPAPPKKNERKEEIILINSLMACILGANEEILFTKGPLSGQKHRMEGVCCMKSELCFVSITPQKTTVHQVTTMLSTSKTVLFPGYNHLLTTSADDLTL